MVSNEDRRLAKNAVDDVLNEWYQENGVGVSTRIVLNATIVNALVSHGWEPRPRISRQELETLMPATVNDLAEYLRTQVGIEVTDD